VRERAAPLAGPEAASIQRFSKQSAAISPMRGENAPNADSTISRASRQVTARSRAAIGA
jgi:hypothetical protein